jgi:pilus assembly protein CpaE
MTVLWEPNRTAADAVVRTLEGSTDVRVVDNLTDAAAWVGYSTEERLVVIGADVPFIDVTAFADYMHTIYPDAVLVLLRHEGDADLEAEAVAAGIADVVPVEDTAALERAVQSARATLAERVAGDDDAPRDQVRKGEVIVVFSPKGGTGKTVVATNLALSLVGAARRRVCLVDLDVEFGDVAICLQLKPVRTIADAADYDLADEASLNALITSHAAGLDCVLAPVNPGDAEKVTVDIVAKLLGKLRARYDYIVVDTPSQLSENVLESFDAANHHLLVTTPEIPALKNARLTLDMLDLLDYRGATRSLVLNRADPKAGISVAEVESALRTAVRVQLPATQTVPTSINQGVPMVLMSPKDQFTAALRAFAQATITGCPPPTTRPRHRAMTLRKRSA